MPCPSPDDVTAYVDDRLDPPARAALEAHVDSCEPCRRLLSQMARLTGSAPAAPEGGDPGPLARMGDVDAPGSSMGRYIVLYRIGEGAMGIVLAAYDPELDRKIAIKLLRGASDGASDDASDDASDRASNGQQHRLLKEARSLARLSHENVVAVHDVGEVGGRVFIAMEHVEGTNLRQWLRAGERSPREILDVFLAAGQGLRAAHDAGLVHRDFKPANVLISETGRVLVTDFGLSHSIDAPESRLEVGGTPAYVSPEQLTGGAADVRSDQFSFCVALYEALFGVRPFAGDSLAELEASVLSGVVAPPKRGGVPRRLRKVLLVGLATRPDERHDSMATLLSKLSRRPQRRAAAAALLGASALVGAWAIHTAGAADPASLCQGGAAKFSAHLGGEQREAIERALVATDVPYAAAAAEGALAELEKFGAAWSETYTESCRATHVRKVQSTARLDAQMTCLSAQLHAFDEIVETLAAADAAMVESAVVAAEKLPPPAACRDDDWLAAKVKPPADPAEAREVAELRRGLAEAKVLFDVGKRPDAAAALEALLPRVRATGYGPVISEVLLDLGRVKAKLGEADEASTLLGDAAHQALAIGVDRTAATAWIEIVRVHLDQSDLPAARAAARIARALLERFGGDAHLESGLENNLGVLAWFDGDLDAADLHLARALELLDEAHDGAATVEVGMVTVNRGMVLDARSHYDESLAAYQRGIDILAATVGDEHPYMASALENVGAALLNANRPSEAIETFRAALAITEANLGPDHPSIAITLTNIASAESKLGKLGRAIELYERAIELARGMDPGDPTVMMLHYNVGTVLIQEQRYGEARGHLDKAVALAEAAFGADHASVASYLTALGMAELRLGRHGEARAAIERAVILFEKGGRHEERADALFAMAKVIDEERRGAPRALARADEALAVYREYAPTAVQVEEIERWLGERR